ncbi:MAG TPA: PIG-L family deacetylase, partial [Pseudonocardia sp.]|nr:PIG-L family deacetylase [Pseudonocardia sp.]
MSVDLADLGTILGVWAHPDDETFLTAGLMALAREAGNRVVCATATRGERGTDDPE